MSSDDIGNRGEAVFRVRITDPYGPRKSPLFRAYHLGEKFPTLDFLIELVGLPTGRVAYFFVQVKATTRGLTRESTGEGSGLAFPRMTSIGCSFIPVRRMWSAWIVRRSGLISPR